MAKLTRRQFIKTLSLGAAAGVGVATYSRDDANWLSLEHTELKLPRWDVDGFRVALVADLHMDNEAEFRRAHRAVSMAANEKPDVLIIGGDFVNHSNPEYLNRVTRVLEPLAGTPFPCLAVLGNHDYACQNPRELMDTIRKSSVRLMRNEIAEVGGVSIAGLDDATIHREKYDFFPKDTVSKSCLVVLHEPDYVRNMPDHASLQVSGHTHGGQVCLPFGYAMHTPRGGRDYISGYYPNAKVPLYVTRGVGTVGVDYRLFCRPEVSILTLRSA
ncbi:MAG TPA: metallophosphoesterase [Fimbriimonadaceae bacterium]|jgi:hypothetical protein